jgi:hypothetical protein
MCHLRQIGPLLSRYARPFRMFWADYARRDDQRTHCDHIPRFFSQRVLSQSILPPPAQDKPNSKKLEAIGYKDMDVDMTQEDVRILPNSFVLE